MTTSCADARLASGAYLLGALEPPERAALEQHLETCPACRDEIAELAVLPGLLGRVDLAALSTDEPAPRPELLDRLLAVAANERRAARRRRFLAAAAVVAVVGAGAAAVTAQVAEGGHRPSTVATQVFDAVDPSTHVRAQVAAVAKDWGTAVRVRLSGVREGETCSLVVVSRTGKREVAATWKVGYQGVVDVDGATEWSPSDIASYDVMTADGRRLVSVPA
jgi:predicted anti-sigma-YlaC factor YlaD